MQNKKFKPIVDLNTIESNDGPTDSVNGLVIVQHKAESYEFFKTLNNLIKQSNKNTFIFLPWEHSSLNCQERSTFWN